MTRYVLIAATSLLAAACQSFSPDPDTDRLQQDYQRFLTWFAGEFDNHEQVWQQRLDGETPKERIHHIFQPVEIPAITGATFFVKQYMDGDYENVYRQRLYQLQPVPERQAIELTIYRFRDEQAYRYADQQPEQLQTLQPEELVATPGCEVYWHYNGEYYDGLMDAGECSYFSQRLNKKIIISDTLRLTESEIWIADQAVDEAGNRVFGDPEGVPHKNRKVTYYKGYAVIARQQLDPSAAADDYLVIRDLRLHNEGDRQPLLDEQGQATGFEIELSRLTYQNTRTPITVLKAFRQGEEQSFSYSWASQSARRVGFNLRWFQVGLTAEGPIYGAVD